MCQARIPSQSPSLGAWANVQGHGIETLQTSNQSPDTRHSGMSAMSPLFSAGLGIGPVAQAAGQLRRGRAADLDDLVDRRVRPLGRLSDRLRGGRLVEAVGAPL